MEFHGIWKPINPANGVHQAILNIIWNWKKTQKCAFKKNLGMLSLQALIVFWLQSFWDAQWFDICWLEMTTKSTGFQIAWPPFSAYPHSIPKGVAKRSQTFANHACRRWPANQAIVGDLPQVFCTASVGVCWCSYSACIDLLVDQRLFMNLCTSKKIYEANESCQKLKFQQWWLLGFFQQVRIT